MCTWNILLPTTTKGMKVHDLGKALFCRLYYKLTYLNVNLRKMHVKPKNKLYLAVAFVAAIFCFNS